MGVASWVLGSAGGAHLLRILLVYLIYLFVFTLAPFSFSVDPSASFSILFDEKFESLNHTLHRSAWDLVSNFLLFLPFGFLLAALPTLSCWKPSHKVILSATCACALSLAIELCQLFLPRAPSAVDVLMNTAGGMIGAIISVHYYTPLARFTQRCWWDGHRNRFLQVIVSVYVMGLLLAYSLPLPLRPDFGNWDLDFPFQLGNEAGLDRPWLGKMYLVAMYDRALSSEGVLSNFSAGPFHNAAENRVHDGLVALYSFTEGSGDIVHDRSSFGSPLDLQIGEPGHIRWLAPNGIEFLLSTSIFHPRPSKKFSTSSMYLRNQLTLETWIATAHVEQSGPARIISYSPSANRRNFTLGQEGRNIVFRLRTPVSGLNGTQPQLVTKDFPVTKGLQHLVITYRNGVETLYVNAKEHASILLNDNRYLREKLEELWGSNYTSVYWSSLYPVGFLSYVAFLNRTKDPLKAVLLSALLGLASFVALEGLQTIITKADTNFSSIPAGVGTVLVSILTSAVLMENIRTA